MSNPGQPDGEHNFSTTAKPTSASYSSLTWIDEQRASWPYDDFRTGRWRVFGIVDGDCFMVQHESGSGDSMGGADATYPACIIAAAIERWSAPYVGVDATPTFFRALEKDAVAAELKAQEARVVAIMSRALANSMRARAKIAQADAAQRGWSMPFAPTANDEEAGHDG